MMQKESGSHVLSSCMKRRTTLKKVLAPEGQILFFPFPGCMIHEFISHEFRRGGQHQIENRRHAFGYRLQCMVFQRLLQALGGAGRHDYTSVGPLARTR